QLSANHAPADPSVILIAPFTWFDQIYYAGVRSHPALAQQWRDIGRSISSTNPPNTNPPLPAPVSPRLQVGASDVQHFFVYDLNCNTSTADVCAIQLHWQAANATLGTQLYMRQGNGIPQLLSCPPSQGSCDVPSI